MKKFAYIVEGRVNIILDEFNPDFPGIKLEISIWFKVDIITLVSFDNFLSSSVWNTILAPSIKSPSKFNFAILMEKASFFTLPLIVNGESTVVVIFFVLLSVFL